MNMVDRDALPDNLKGTFDDLNEFIEAYVMHAACIENHRREMEQLTEEIQPRIRLITDHLREHSHLRVFDEFMNTVWESKPNDEG